MEFKGTIISVVLLMLFIYAMISFSTQISTENNSTDMLMSESVISTSYSSISSNMTKLKSDSESQRGSFIESIPIVGDIVAGVGAIAGFGKTFVSAIISFFGLTFGLFQTALGLSPIVMTVFSIIVISGVILLLWSVWRVGR